MTNKQDNKWEKWFDEMFGGNNLLGEPFINNGATQAQIKSFIKEVEAEARADERKRIEEILRTKIGEAWTFMEDSFWEDTMANHWDNGEPFLKPNELDIAKEIMVNIIKDNIQDAIDSALSLTSNNQDE